MARGSSMEAAAIVDLLAARGLATAAVADGARSLLVRIVQMLTRMAADAARR